MSARAKSAPAATRPERSEVWPEGRRPSDARGGTRRDTPGVLERLDRRERPRSHSDLGVLRLVEYNLIAARRYWRSVVIVGVITPVLFVVALGVGLGKVVNSHGGHHLGVPYLDFVAPAFLTSAALQVAANEATYPVMAGFKWLRFFHGMAATPLSSRQICDGTLLWIGLRVFVNSAVYLAIIAAFGGVPRVEALLSVLAATLVGVAFAAPVLALSASVEAEGQAFNILARFVVTPMFLFSGTFYPISQLPAWGEWLARITPLWHGTQLARASALGHMSGPVALGHVAYLLAWLVVGLLLARWRFRWRIER
jgi:lipooligosaccharide transport system permease protein